MQRREFMAQLAAGVVCAGFLLPGRARAESVNIGIVPIGKRGRILAADLVRMVTGTTPLANVGLIDPNIAQRFRDQLDGVVIFGCLGGRTGLDDAAACGQIVRQSPRAAAVLLWPMDFEGSRRRASAHIAAGRIDTHGIEVIPLMVEVPRQVTLNEARELRERTLLERGVGEVEKFFG